MVTVKRENRDRTVASEKGGRTDIRKRGEHFRSLSERKIGRLRVRKRGEDGGKRKRGRGHGEGTKVI